MKKLVSLLLAALLVLSLATTAFAAEDFTDQTSVTVTKVYKLIGEGASPAETFTLQQISAGVVTDGDATAAPDLGTITGAAFAEGEATTDGTAKPITITLPAYSLVGKYEYVLREVIGTNAGVTYYGSDIKLIVTVINDEETGTIRVGAVHTEAADGGNYNPATKSDEIENTYSAGTLEITKTVAGNLGDKTKYFEFTLTLTAESGKDYASGYAVTGGSYESNPTSVTVGGTATFYLKDGETISIANLPYGVGYTVVEKNYDDYELTKSGDVGTIHSAKQTAAFTNTKGGYVDTGIALDSMPYVLMLGLAAMFGTALVMNRKREN